MKQVEKLEALRAELDLIKTPEIKEFAEWAVRILPNYFFTVPASSSGKYHPEYALGEGGLLRHTKAAVGIAVELLRLEMFSNHYAPGQQDAIIVALILHDGAKSGIPKQKYTIKNHPRAITAHLEKNVDAGDCPLTTEQRQAIYGLMESHMGQWTASDADTPLPKPTTQARRFVHMCDYLASRKQLEYKF
jgi:hypothetical protein